MQDGTAAVGAPESKASPCANCLPAKGGGGIALPRGVAGHAFSLDEADFRRFCAAQGERERRKRTLEARIYGFKDMRVLAFWVAAYLSYIKLAIIVNTARTAATLFHVAGSSLYIGALIFFSWRAPAWFSAAFPDAGPIPALKRWNVQARFDKGRKALSAFWFRAMHVAVPFFLAFLASAARDQNTVLGFVIGALGALAVLEGLFSLAFLCVYLPVRFGRAPTPADLEPI